MRYGQSEAPVANGQALAWSNAWSAKIIWREKNYFSSLQRLTMFGGIWAKPSSSCKWPLIRSSWHHWHDNSAWVWSAKTFRVINKIELLDCRYHLCSHICHMKLHWSKSNGSKVKLKIKCLQSKIVAQSHLECARRPSESQVEKRRSYKDLIIVVFFSVLEACSQFFTAVRFPNWRPNEGELDLFTAVSSIFSKTSAYDINRETLVSFCVKLI